MKFIKYFNEAAGFDHSLWYDINLYDSPGNPSIEDFRSKIRKKIDFDRVDFEKLSEFFEENYPHIDYSRGYNEYIKKFKSTWGQNRDLFSLHIPLDSLDDNNSFVVSFISGRTMIPKTAVASRNRPWQAKIHHMMIILKTDDEYFLVLEKQHLEEWGSEGAKGFICDSMDGLIDFFDAYIESSKKNFYPAGGYRSWGGSAKSNWVHHT